MNYLPLFSSDFPDSEMIAEIKGERARELIKLHQLSAKLEIRALVFNQSTGIAIIKQVDKDYLRLEYRPVQNKFSKNSLTLLVGLSRPQTIKKVLAAAVGFGVESLIFVNSETSENSYLSSSIWQQENLDKALILAMAQAGDPIAPKVSVIKNFKDISIGFSDYQCYLADLQAEPVRVPSSLANKPKLLAIGPEKGWSADEKQFFKESNFNIVSFGSRILRVEQALVASLGQIF